MEAAIIVAIVTAVANIVIAVINGNLAKEQKITKEQTKRQAELRRKESQLCMRMINANTELTICMALNLTRDITLCDIEKELKNAEEAKKEYEKFLQELGKEEVL